MTNTAWIARLGILSAMVSAAVVAHTDGIAARTTPVQTAVVTGAHAHEEFCTTMVREAELFGEYLKMDLFNPDPTKRAKHFADRKALNAVLVKTAPAALAGDVALFTKNANASSDAQLTRDPARIKATAVPLRSPEHRAAAKRMNDYCGVQITAPK